MGKLQKCAVEKLRLDALYEQASNRVLGRRETIQVAYQQHSSITLSTLHFVILADKSTVKLRKSKISLDFEVQNSKARKLFGISSD